MALVELSFVEQRYRAVLDAAAGVPVTEVAEACGVPRQSVHAWIRRHAEGGLAGPERLPSPEPVTVQRRASNTGVIMVVGQKIALGRIHAGQIVTVHVAEDTMTVDLGGDDTRTIRRATTQAVRSIKAHRPRRRPAGAVPAAGQGGSLAPDCSHRAHPQEAGSQ